MFIDPSIIEPLPGDYQCVSVGGQAGKLIALGERLNGDAFTQYQHVRVYMGGMQAVEADPGGARLITLPSFDSAADVLWSTGAAIAPDGKGGWRVPDDLERQGICHAARGYADAHAGYSALDYFALALHHFRIPFPGVRALIASSGRMICSQLVDQCYQDGGVHLFDDGRWPGYVTPADLAALVERYVSQ
jgi:hypothetical protein